MQKKVTISDIAQVTGFGRSTISYVLAGKNLNRIKKSTQKCIWDAAKRLNYKPNLLARSLRCGQSKLIGVIFDKDANHFKLDLLQGIENVLSAKGYHLIFCYFHTPDEIPMKTTQLVDHFIDGVIIRSSLWDECSDTVKRLLPDSMPLVRLAIPNDKIHPTANVNATELGRLSIQYLADMGHSRIAISSTLPLERRNVMIKFCNDFQMASPIILPQCTSEELLEQMLSLGTQVTALVAEDEEASKLLYCARKRNINIPERFSVLGNDGLECGLYAIPSLSTIAQPQQEQGEEAARMLIEWLEKNTVPASSELNPFLIERNSVKKLR